jgi:purine-nucleoside phosphorylase
MRRTTTLDLEIRDAVDAIVERRQISPQFGIVLGSGLGSLADSMIHPTDIPYAEIPGFPQSHAAGHAGSLRLGFLGGLPVVAMCGRAHLYEGHDVDRATFPIRVLHALGAHSLIVSNASGGLNPRFASGELILIDQHINGMGRSAVPYNERLASSGQVTHVGPFYDEAYMEHCQSIALRQQFQLQRGTYLATLGPTYETRAEYRYFRSIGADMAGMSTVPEVELGRALGMRVLAFSVVTNVANPDSLAKTDHAEVLDWAATAQKRLVPLVIQFLDELSGPPD